jgi:pyruvate dehydrogenase E2 component (dihydrolipoamide acetyltransferase)
MAHNVIMPQGGQDLEKGTVVRWLKQEKEAVKKGEVLCEVETEKAVFEVQSPADGFLIKIVVPEGGEAAILSTIGIIGQSDEVPAAVELGAKTIPASAIESLPEKTIAGIGEAMERHLGSEQIRISPKAKKIALDKGINYDNIIGSGPQGRIIEKDILAHLELQMKKPATQEKITATEGKLIIPLSKTRKVIARRMQQSKQIIPHFYVTVAVNMTEALKFRSEFNRILANPKEDGLSVTDMIVRACALAMREFPELNSSVQDEDNLILWEDINIGIAVATDDGLIVPVLEKADKLTLGQIAQESRKLAKASREGKQVSFAPGRFTISNLGMFNVESFIAIINPPEAAILAVASVEKKIVPLDDNNIGIRDFLNMTLSIDHRLGDGVLAAKYLNKVKSLLEIPQDLT